MISALADIAKFLVGDLDPGADEIFTVHIALFSELLIALHKATGSMGEAIRLGSNAASTFRITGDLPSSLGAVSSALQDGSQLVKTLEFSASRAEGDDLARFYRALATARQNEAAYREQSRALYAHVADMYEARNGRPAGVTGGFNFLKRAQAERFYSDFSLLLDVLRSRISIGHDPLLILRELEPKLSEETQLRGQLKDYLEARRRRDALPERMLQDSPGWPFKELRLFACVLYLNREHNIDMSEALQVIKSALRVHRMR